MRAVVQRVNRARVVSEDVELGAIDRGLVVLVAFRADDEEEQLRWVAEKLWGLRIFPDEADRMNRSARDVGGSLLAREDRSRRGALER
jgi:D-tyrosyl-tRNA(Tyr) deacylase